MRDLIRFRVGLLLSLLFVLSAWSSGMDGNVQAKTYKKGFAYHKISSEMKSQMTGKSFPRSGAKISFSDLREVRVKYYDFKGKVRTGSLVVNKKIALKTAKIFYELYQIRYPVQKLRPIDMYDADDTRSMEANNTSAFNYRRVQGSTKLSMHSKGLAIDLNPRINPCIRNGVVDPPGGKVYKNRNVRKCKGKYRKYMIHKGDRVYKIFKKYGFKWGGEWYSLKDYQHFEYVG
ncbi:MAG: M15 family metallopeptidase [Eubacterium sp.]|nr:M15 family metallopeptidase [Eubacterium sp.]